MKKFLNSVFLFFFLIVASDAGATHLVGGNLGYEYVGSVGGGNFRYRVTFTTFIDCNSPFWGSGFPEPSIVIGIYEGTATQSGNAPYRRTLTLPLISSNSITPPLPNGCTVGTSSCMYEVVYRATIDLPQTMLGYYLYYDRCCRNNSIVNLNDPGAQANPSYAYIPPSLVINSSPKFADVPTAFLCVGDTTTLLNTAFDPDGDELVFSFVEPFKGYAISGNADPGPNFSGLNFPVPTVDWLPGYSGSQAFGNSGYSFIDAITGTTKYKPVIQGNFVVAVEIKEYRNNILIGKTRRDLQYLATTCPSNPPPKLSLAVNGGSTNFEVVEGNTLCFPITLTDASNQTITLSSNGLIFDPAYTNPPATITTPQSGVGSVTAQFCWPTGCGQSSEVPYLFTASATDNGCPPKTANMAYSVKVKPFGGPTSMSGNNVVCQNSIGSSYSVGAIAGASYNWTVTGGAIVSGANSNSITVNWGNNPGLGSIKLITVSDKGCSSEELVKEITITPSPSADAGLDKVSCNGDSVLLGGNPTGPPGSTYSWTPGTGLSSSVMANPKAKPASNTTYILTVTNSSCTLKDTVLVKIGAIVDAGSNAVVCFGDSTRLSASLGMVSYKWSPSIGLSSDSVGNPWAKPALSTMYFLTGVDSNSCTSVDSVFVLVNPLPQINAGNDTSICFGKQVVLGGFPAGPQGAVYAWHPSSQLNDSTLANPLATPLVNTSFVLTLRDTNSCVKQDTIQVSILALPLPDAGNDIAVCKGDTVFLSGAGGGTYSWSPGQMLDDSTASSTWTIAQLTASYLLTVTDSFNCVATDTLQVFVNPLPIINAGKDSSICNGMSIELGGTPTAPMGAMYLWKPSLGLNADTVSNPISTAIVSTNYELSVIDTNGCRQLDTVIITVNPLPTVDAGVDTIICIQTVYSLGGSPTSATALSYSWYPSGMLDNPSASNPFAQVDSVLTFFVTVLDLNACSNVDSVTVSVYSKPTVVRSNDTAVCRGDTVFLMASGGQLYNWEPSTYLDDPTTSDPICLADSSVKYLITVTDINGCSNKDSISITINQLPLVDAGENEWICPGDNIQLNASGGIIYFWNPSSGLSDPNIFNPLANPADSTLYHVLVTDANGCKQSDSLFVGVNDAVPTFAGNDTTICFGDSALLGGHPTSPNGTIYLWSPGAGLNDSTISNPTARPLITTVYYLYTANDTCSGFDSVVVYVNPLPTIITGVDTAICLNDSLRLMASGGVDYLWMPSFTLNDSLVNNPIAHPLTTTDYIVKVTDINTCISFDTLTVIVYPLPMAVAGQDEKICFGDSVQLTASGGKSYFWTPSMGLSSDAIYNPKAAPIVNSEYIVYVTDSNACKNTDTLFININPLPIADAGIDLKVCLKDTLSLAASGGDQYAWYPNYSISDTSVYNPQVYPTDSMFYYVQVTDTNLCLAIDSVYITVMPLPIAFAGEDTSLCVGGSIELSASGGIVYSWSPSIGLSDTTIFNPIASPVLTTNFIVKLEDLNACLNRDTIQVLVHSLPMVDAGKDTSVCHYNSISLLASGAEKYLWNPEDLLQYKDSAAPLIHPKIPTTYYVIGSDTNGCTNIDSVSVFVFRISVGPDASICQKDSISISVTANALANYSWSPVFSLEKWNEPVVWAFPNQTTNYMVVGTDSAGCKDTSEVKVNVNITPTAALSMELHPGCNGLTATFSNNSYDAEGGKWYYENQIFDANDGITVLFPYNSDHVVKLLASTNNQCVDSVSKTLSASNFKDYFDFEIPNVFTPNKDGANDTYYLKLKDELKDCIDMAIYNRWGEILFKSNPQSLEWDGKNAQGKELPEGTYMYTITILGDVYQGTITLIR